MRQLLALIVALPLIVSCQAPRPYAYDETSSAMFGPSAMRIHPIFTGFKDFTGDGRTDGIEVLIEFQDQFGDLTKAAGYAIFELYEYRRGFPDPRGERIGEPVVWSLLDIDEQRQHWSRTSRTYAFQLRQRDLRRDRPHVVAAIFTVAGGGRFFDQIILEPPREEASRAGSGAVTIRQPAEAADGS